MKNLRTLLVAGLLSLLLLAACAGSATPPATAGIAGETWLGPNCPVLREGEPCPDTPYQATVTVLNTAGEVVTQFQTDAGGHFQVNLAPGEYTLRPESPNALPHAGELVVVVKPNEFTPVKITYDSGIR